jgi:Predicted acetyltransferases and hydrolases with the alpha/beta hydrolase fold
MPIIVKPKSRGLVSNAAVCVFFAITAVLSITAQGKNPVIVIPGLTGSELVSTKNGAVVWFNVRRSRTDDLSLPISPNIAANHDSLVPRDILRSVKIGILPKTDAYEGLLTALETRGGYKEGKWDNPPINGYQDTVYVFPYDWRRDNVENARLLIRRIETLKRRLKRPNLKFDVIAHSMGGLIARYAAMYGDADLPVGTRKPRPTWAGARNFDKIVLLGTPNEGSVMALNSLLNGFSLFGIQINLPFIQNLSKFDLFTIPSGYQLLPFDGTLKVYDEDLKPLKLDLYNPETWSEYGWDVIDDKQFVKKFSAAEQKNAKAYFVAVLDRAKRFQDSLNAVPSVASPTSISVMGAECRDTLDGVVVFQDAKSGKWKTIFKPEAFTTSSGKKVTADEVRSVMYTPGDGVVAKSSLTTSSLSLVSEIKDILFPVPTTFVCEDHNRLPASPEIQNDILALLTGIKPANAAPVKAVALR